jgi:hypothetical protein
VDQQSSGIECKRSAKVEANDEEQTEENLGVGPTRALHWSLTPRPLPLECERDAAPHRPGRLNQVHRLPILAQDGYVSLRQQVAYVYDGLHVTW